VAGAAERRLLSTRSGPASFSEAIARRLLESDARVVVLGATGWLGMVALEQLETALGSTFGRRVSAWASRARVERLRSGREVEVCDFGDLSPRDVDGALVLHFAFLTRDRVTSLGVDEFLRANLVITHRVLSLLASGHPTGLVYASSGAVYGVTGGLTADVTSNPYGAAKRLDELAFRAACRDVGASCVIPRVFSVTGPYMTKQEHYVLGDLILQASRSDRLWLRARRPVYRSYVAVADLLSVCVASALDGENDLVFDSGGDVVEVGELAELVRDVVGHPDMAIEREWDPTAEPDRYVAEPSAMEGLARRFGVSRRPLPDQVRETASDLLRGAEPARP
jgi:UDP-glucuronate decarboxylase